MSVELTPQHNIPYFFIAYDKQGHERTGHDGTASVRAVEAVNQEDPTDVFVFCHGWNTSPSESIEQYGRWIDAMAARDVDRARLNDRAGGFRPLLVGLHWPSKAWADENLTGLSYAIEDGHSVEPSTLGTSQTSVPSHESDLAAALVAEYVDRLGDSEQVRGAVDTIVRAGLRDAAPNTLPDDVRLAYEQLDASLGLGAGGEGSAPGEDREPFDAEATYQATLFADIADPLAFGELSFGGVLAPLRVLSFWAMKRRALSFGETGAASLLHDLQEAAAPTTKFHVVGHSFGCIVASAAVAEMPKRSSLSRRVHTLVLLQGAMSHWSFCREIPARPGHEGYFHRVIRDHLVGGEILVSTSRFDRADRVFYPIGAGARGDVEFGTIDLPAYGALGTFGANGPGIEIEREHLESVDEDYVLRPGAVYNLDGDNVINSAAGIGGAHNDICHPEVARAIWRAVESPAVL